MTKLKANSTYGENRAIIVSNEVNLSRGSFIEFKKLQEEWKLNDYYSNPGPT